jgi:pimeloyl-ACP methyl ester carboxylesterase
MTQALTAHAAGARHCGMPQLHRDGVTIHYEVHGPGHGPGPGPSDGRVPVLLSHGFSASTQMWAKNVDVLAAERTVVTWDLRGHGASDSPDDAALYTPEACLDDMAAVLDACGIERATLGGHSLGGFLSLAFRLVHRDRVAALLLCNTGPGYRQPEGREAWNRMAEGFAVGFEERGLDALSGSPEVTGGRHDPAGLARAARGILVQHDARVIESLPDIDVPTLVVVGDNDRPFLAAADYLAAKIPGAEKALIAGAGHAANVDQPATFNRIVGAFLASVPART